MAHRHSFLCVKFSCYLGLESYSLGYVLLTLLCVLYVTVLTVVCYRNYDNLIFPIPGGVS